jgi:hypothetical protein
MFFKKDQTEFSMMANERMKSVVSAFPPIALIVFQLRPSNTAITKSQIESISISFFPDYWAELALLVIPKRFLAIKPHIFLKGSRF